MKTLEIVAKIQICSHTELTDEQKTLVEAAKSATLTSYSPFSHYQVGAAVMLEGGEIVCGSNQENAAYPSGLCAERTALFYAGAKYPNVPVRKIAIIARHDGAITPEVCTPCGACRQVLCESEARAKAPIEVLMCSASKVYVARGIESLLPLSFTAGTMDSADCRP